MFEETNFLKSWITFALHLRMSQITSNSTFDQAKYLLLTTCNKCGQVQYISLEVKIKIDALHTLALNLLLKKAIKMNTFYPKATQYTP